LPFLAMGSAVATKSRLGYLEAGSSSLWISYSSREGSYWFLFCSFPITAWCAPDFEGIGAGQSVARSSVE
jgi:hypothetical protein